jgi:hypothetical protein
MLRLLYVESVKKEVYNQWLCDRSGKLHPISSATEKNLKDMDTPTKERHDIGYISQNLESWKLSAEAAPTACIPTFDEVKAAKDTTVPTELEYERDGLVWRSDCHVEVLSKGAVPLRRLVLHFPNDGFFYVDESLLPVLAGDQCNDRHENTCREGWAFLDQQVWPKLTAFETFVREWFGYDESNKIQRQIVYHGDENRMDICLLCPETNVAVDFVFKPGFPVPEEFWS